MEKVERLIKEYLKKNTSLGCGGKSADCLSESILLEYLENKLDDQERARCEHHIAGCGFCLSQLDIAFQSQQMKKQAAFDPVPRKLLDRTRSLLGIGKDNENTKIDKGKTMRRRSFLVGTIIFFALSFFIPRYFMQFLIAALILGIRWSFESESGRTLIMVLDSWRRHSQDKDDEINRRLRSRL